MAAPEGSVEWLDRDLEARKHLWKGLERLGPQGRIAFIQSLCGKIQGQAKGPADAVPKITSHTGTANEAYWDCCYLAVLHGLSLSRACEELERWLKQGR